MYDYPITSFWCNSEQKYTLHVQYDVYDYPITSFWCNSEQKYTLHVQYDMYDYPIPSPLFLVSQNSFILSSSRHIYINNIVYILIRKLAFKIRGVYIFATKQSEYRKRKFLANVLLTSSRTWDDPAYLALKSQDARKWQCSMVTNDFKAHFISIKTAICTGLALISFIFSVLVT